MKTFFCNPSDRFSMKLMVLLGAALLLLVGEGSAERVKRDLSSPLHRGGIRDPFGSYCQRRGGCCPGRDDLCTVPYLDTICYCDLFCNRTVSDCCPDFWGRCLGIEPPFIGKHVVTTLSFNICGDMYGMVWYVYIF